MSKKRKILLVIAASLFMFGATTTVTAAERSSETPLLNKNIMLATADGHHADQAGMESCQKHKKGYGNKMMSKVDTDGDGKISRREYMKHHGVMFDENDANKDGFMDKNEMREMMKRMHGYSKSEHGHGGHDDDKAHNHDHDDHDHGDDDKAHSDMKH